MLQSSHLGGLRKWGTMPQKLRGSVHFLLVNNHSLNSCSCAHRSSSFSTSSSCLTHVPHCVFSICFISSPVWKPYSLLLGPPNLVKKRPRVDSKNPLPTSLPLKSFSPKSAIGPARGPGAEHQLHFPCVAHGLVGDPVAPHRAPPELRAALH